MKEIVYLNTAEAIPPKRDNGKWSVEELCITKPPTLCKVIINKSVVINNVYVCNHVDQPIRLFEDYYIHKRGWACAESENCWPIFIGRKLVLEFKSDDFTIEAC